MVEAIRDFLIENFSNIVWLAVLFLSMIPITEARIAIPFALDKATWGEKTLSPLSTIGLCLLGGLIVSTVLLLVLRPFFSWLKKKEKIKNFIVKIENSYKDKISKKTDKENIFLKCFAIFSFVAIPLPFTGVWTGSLIASCTTIGFWQSLLTINLGNIVANCLLLLICTIFPNSTLIIIFTFLGLVVLFAVYKLIKFLIKKKQNKVVENVKVEENITDKNIEG